MLLLPKIGYGPADNFKSYGLINLVEASYHCRAWMAAELLCQAADGNTAAISIQEGLTAAIFSAIGGPSNREEDPVVLLRVIKW